MRSALQSSDCLPRHGPHHISSTVGSDSMKSKSYRKVGNYDNSTGRINLNAMNWFAATYILAAGVPCLAQAQSASSLDEIVVTAKSLEETLPQQLSQYGTRVSTITAAQIQNGGYIDVASALEALA